MASYAETDMHGPLMRCYLSRCLQRWLLLDLGGAAPGKMECLKHSIRGWTDHVVCRLCMLTHVPCASK